MTPRQSPSDQPVRDRIVTLSGRNLVVEASAGTGKTTLMVDRVIDLVSRGTSLLDIAVVTFTRAATAELRRRIREKLLEQAPDDQRFRRALQDLPLATIATIDGFASSVLREHCHIADVDPDYATQAGHFDPEEVARLWDGYLYTLNPDTLVECTGLLRIASRGELLDLAIKMENCYWLQNPRAFGELETTWEELRAELSDHIDLIHTDRLCTDPTDALCVSQMALRRALAELERQLDRGRSFDQAKIKLRLNEVRLGGGKQASWGGREGKERIKAALSSIKDRLKEWLPLKGGQVMLPQVEALLWPFVLDLRERWRSDRSRFSYPDLLTEALHALQRDARLREALRARYRHVLLDEFQDTSDLQVRLFSAFLSDGGEFDPDRITVVGDPKQSIYGWRSADVETYREALSRLAVPPHGIQETIEVNFRSTRSIIRFVEAFGPCLFEAATEEERRFACAYSPLLPGPGAEEGQPVEVYVHDPEARSPERTEAEAAWIADQIERCAEQGIEFGDWAVLFRRGTKMETYLAALEDRSIPYVVEAGRDFRNRQEAADLRELIRCLVSPSDKLALVHTLRSPVFGIDDPTITDALESGLKSYLEPAGSLPGQLDQALQMLRRLREAALTRPLADLLSAIYLHTGLLSSIAFSGHQVARRLGNLQYVMELVLGGEVRTCRELIAVLEQKAAGLGIEEVAQPPPDRSAVTLSTIHKAKGLDYERVIIADLAVDTGGHNVSWKTYDHGRMAAFRLGTGDTSIRSPLWNRIEEIEQVREVAETRRMLYVAATRAKTSLQILLTPIEKRRDRPTIGEMAWRALEQAIEADPGCCRKHELPSIERGPRPGRTRDVPKDLPERPLPDLDISIPPVSREYTSPETELGNAVHAILQKVDFGDPSGWAESHPHQLELLAGDYAEEALELALSFFEMDKPFDLDSCTILGHEYSYIGRGESGPEQRYIDLLLDDGEKLIVVDYKTDRIPPGGAEALAAEYRAQLEGYVDSVEKAFGRPAVGYLALLRGRRLLPI